MAAAALADEVRAMFREDWNVQLADNPEYASQSGVQRYDHELQDLSPQAFAKRVEYNEKLLLRVDGLMHRVDEELSRRKSSVLQRARTSLQMFRQSIYDESSSIKLGCHLYPINSIGYGGVYNNFVEMLEWVESAPARLSRVKQFPAQVKTYIQLLREGIKRGRIASSCMVRSFVPQLQAGITDLKNEAGPVADAVDGLDGASEALHSFKLALEDLHLFIETEYSASVLHQPGCMRFSDGQELYALALRFHTTTEKSASEIHSIGLAEVERIEKRIQVEVLNQLDFHGTCSDLCEYLKTKPEHFFTDAGALISAYRAACSKIETILPSVFKTFPKMPLQIVEKHAPNGPGAYYLAGTPDGSRPGRFYVNTSRLSSRPSYEIMALAMHEAVPGHHHQGALSLENDMIPEFVRFVEDRRYEFCPARRQLYAAYLEGWALYCEALGEELGLYDGPLELFGRLSCEMMRAVRLVVDTGIHSFDWPIEKAIAYMQDKTGMHREECEAEVYRYEAWPGQACAYKLGEICIWEMRRRAEHVLGAAKFNLSEFHDLLLIDGPLPLGVLSEVVEEWIAHCLKEA